MEWIYLFLCKEIKSIGAKVNFNMTNLTTILYKAAHLHPFTLAYGCIGRILMGFAVLQLRTQTHCIYLIA